MCLLEDGSRDYTPLTESQERKIGSLYRRKSLPPVFTLKGKRIDTTTILGFSDKPVPSGIKSMGDLRTWVHSQKWYKPTALVQP